jgi:hypothetical protein
METILAVAGMLLLRLGVPIGFMVVLSWGVSRYVSRDEERAEAKATARTAPVASRRAVAPKVPCWQVKGCAPAAVTQCPAGRRTDLPCWLARQVVEGKMLATCPSCVMYRAGAGAPAD